MAFVVRAALTASLSLLPLSSALAGDLTSVQGINGVAAQPAAQALPTGGALQWWPVAQDGGGWTLSVQQVSATLEPAWTASLPLSSDAVRSPEVGRGAVAALSAYIGHRPETVAQVLPHDGGALVVYPDGGHLMGVQIGADGTAGAATELAPLTHRSTAGVQLVVSPEADRVAVVDQASRLAVVQADGTVAFQVQLPYTEGYDGEGTGTKVLPALARKKTGWTHWAPAFGAGGSVLAVGLHDEGDSASVAWFDPAGASTAVTRVASLGTHDQVRGLVSGEGTVLVFSKTETLGQHDTTPGARGTSLNTTRMAFVDPAEKGTDAMDVATGASLTQDLGGTKGYFPGRLRLLSLEADGAGGVVTALRSSQTQVMEVRRTNLETGMSQTSERYIHRVGNVVVQRISPDGDAVWTRMLPGEAKSSGAPHASVGAAPMAVSDGSLQVVYLSHACGLQALSKSGRWSVGRLSLEDGAQQSLTCFGDELPTGVTLDRGLTLPGGDSNTLTLGFRANPPLRTLSVLFSPGKIDNERLFVVTADPAAEAETGWATPFAQGDDEAAFEAGYAYALATRPRGLAGLPVLRGFVLGLGTGAVTGTLAGLPNDPGVGSIGVLTSAGLGGVAGGYLARRPKGFWGAQSSSFQEGYRKGFDKRSVRRSALGGVVGGFVASGVATALLVDAEE